MDQQPKEWKVLSERLHAKCRIFEIYKQRCEQADSEKSGDFYILKSQDWVQVIPLTSDNKVVLVQQYRFGSQSLSWEIPGGVLDPGESPVEGALRELREETGYVGESPELISSLYPNPAIQENKVHFFVLKNVECKLPTEWDEHEELRVKEVSLDEVMSMVFSGEMNHSIAVNGIFLMKDYLDL